MSLRWCSQRRSFSLLASSAAAPAGHQVSWEGRPARCAPAAPESLLLPSLDLRRRVSSAWPPWRNALRDSDMLGPPPSLPSVEDSWESNRRRSRGLSCRSFQGPLRGLSHASLPRPRTNSLHSRREGKEPFSFSSTFSFSAA